eukprot:RCo036091
MPCLHTVFWVACAVFFFAPLFAVTLYSLWFREHVVLYAPLRLIPSPPLSPRRDTSSDGLPSGSTAPDPTFTSTRSPLPTGPPAAVKLTVEDDEDLQHHASALQGVDFGVALKGLAFVGLLVCSYAVLRAVVVASGARCAPKSLPSNFNDVTVLTARGLTVFMLGNVQRFRILPLGAQAGAVLALFTVLSQFGPRVMLSGDPGQDWVLVGLTILLLVGLLALLLTHHLLVAHQLGKTCFYLFLGAFLGVVAVHAAAAAVPFIRVHLHHYYFTWVAAHFLRFDTVASRTAQVYCVAVMIHGLTLFGAGPVFS